MNITEITKHLKTLSTPRVSVYGCQGRIYFRIIDNIKSERAEMLEIKRQAIDYVMSNDKTRKWRHMSDQGYRIWWWYGESAFFKGLMCGIKADLSEDEHNADLRGVRF